MKNRLTMAAILLASLAGTAGIASAQDYRYDDGRYDNRYENRYDNGYYDRDDFRDARRVARDFGWRDGSEVAREDMWHGKRFNPNPRGRFDDADHGYRREFGSIREYREHYARAYHEGYERSFRGGRDWR